MAKKRDSARSPDRHRSDIDALARALVSPFGASHRELSAAMTEAVERGAIPFEAVTGVPHDWFGARVTLDLEKARKDTWDVLGVIPHSWGHPRWVGLRVGPDGRVRTKGYHSPGAMADGLSAPPPFPTDLKPVMVAQEGEVREVYYVARKPYEWEPFATACLAPVGGALGAFEPQPRSARRGFGVSLKWNAKDLTSVTVFAHRLSLPGDAEIPPLWMRDMSADDCGAYRVYLAAVKAFGPPVSDWHSLLCWTRDLDRGWTRAASLRIPTLEGHHVASGQ